MKISGFHKTTLVDYPGKIACTIFLNGCNFRCGFCHNPELVIKENENEFSQKEILEFLKKRKGEIEGICITGGEPLLNLEKTFLKEIKSLGYEIKIDTNGSFPEKLEEIINEKLVDFVSMDIKSSPEKYSEVADAKVDLEKIEKSMKLISEKMKNYEFRTTIIDDIHDFDEVRKIAEWIKRIIGKKAKSFVLQGFKNSGKFIDPSFHLKQNSKEEYLEELKKYIAEDFESVEMRV